MSKWIPQRGPMTFEPDYRPQERTVYDAVLNPLPEGTRVRVTMGEGNVLVGTTKWPDSTQQYGSLAIVLEGQRQGREDYLSLRLKSGWSVEVLDDAATSTQ